MLFKRKRLMKELTNEIKELAGIENEFPVEDAVVFSKILSAYDQGVLSVGLTLARNFDTLEKYPNLCNNWDNLMLKYKEKGLFPNWNVTPMK